MNEKYRLFRSYCRLKIEDVAFFTKIKKKRLIEIETGKVEPTEAEIEKLAALYNMSPEKIKCDLSEIFPTIIKEPLDCSFYKTELDREMMNETVISLTQAERDLILMLRTSDNKEELYNRMVDMCIDEEDIIIRD